jgi:hypothetical protein
VTKHELLGTGELSAGAWVYVCSCGRAGLATGGLIGGLKTYEQKAEKNWRLHKRRALVEGRRLKKDRPPRT